MRAFFYHYNKPASLRAGKNQFTVHYGGACHIVDNVVINVPTYSRARNTQPRAVIAGVCSGFTIEERVAFIV